MTSFILPIRNGMAFLAERLDCLFRQSVTDWELVVIEGESTDGTWEYLQARLQGDPRVRLIRQSPRGIYPAWNAGIREAKGDTISIIPADDTMADNWLSTMEHALAATPEAGMACCPLQFIDEHGAPWSGSRWENIPQQRFYLGAWMDRPHLRRAPHDGLLHAAAGNVYVSITQLLVRRAIFDRVGGFPEQFGIAGDFAWGMVTGLLVNTVHVPGTWATWRRHPLQATQDADDAAPAGRARAVAMVAYAIQRAHEIDPVLCASWWERRSILTLPFRHQLALSHVRHSKNLYQRIAAWFHLGMDRKVLAWEIVCRLAWKGRFHRLHIHRISREIRRNGASIQELP